MDKLVEGIGEESQKLIVFGASGRTGQHFVKQALEKGYFITACARNLTAIKIEHQRLRKVYVDIHDMESVAQAFKGAHDAVVLTLGIFHKTNETPLADGTANIIRAMKEKGLRRLLMVSSLGVGESRGQGNWVVALVTRFILPYVLRDKEVQETLVKQSDLDWTILRPPQLLGKDVTRPYQIWQGRPTATSVRWKVSTGDTARALLQLVQDDQSIGCAYQISY
ncbi:NAD(P)-dependent oxidoreductase [Microbulbifer agarilyticus]|uniref:NAD(P)-dependent oxidoreductase n=1 Tax=Microbulbifer agarilyticus TaxID=260552 RepID=UPI001CD800DA|nr:NAD(P)H-binding protein [Microbulbifer agarilyticus]MCA0900909.1 SDR family oxidoreductase [Microbulbifer agarilyticus]